MSRLNSTQSNASQANVFAALGDATRLELIAKLCDGESRSIVQLTEGFPLTRQAVTKHLGVLEQAGIVHCERMGRESHYAFLPERIVDASSYLNKVSEQWDKALLRLKAFVER